MEKNVENEEDMAIGVSSEQQLQQEGRLYRMNSNMSNLSLRLSLPPRPSTNSASDAAGKSKDTSAMNAAEKAAAGALDAPLEMPVRPFATHQPGQSMNSNVSHQTALSDGDDTAVGTSLAYGGTEPPTRDSFSSIDHDEDSIGDKTSLHSSKISIASMDVDMPRKNASGKDFAIAPRLTFDETRSPAAMEERNGATLMDAEPARPSIGGRNASLGTSVHSTGRSARRRRQRLPQRQQQHGVKTETEQPGAPVRLSFWSRIRQFEFIPTLPEDKLIRRDSPLLRFCLPLSYAALGGMMASYTVLFAKSLINLLVTSIFDGQNQFTSGLAWVILVVTVVTAVSQVYWINMGLKKYDALLQVPVFFTIWVLLDIVGGGIYYGEFSGFTAKKYVLFCFGVLVVFFGVALLAKRLAVLAKEDVGEGGSSGASAPVSRRQSMAKAGGSNNNGKSKEEEEEEEGGSRRASTVKDAASGSAV